MCSDAVARFNGPSGVGRPAGLGWLYVPARVKIFAEIPCLFLCSSTLFPASRQRHVASESPTKIHLRVLGDLDLTDANGQALASVLAQPRRISLLVYLALAAPVGFKRRDTLLALFWPELDDARARAALNKTLHFLRKSLGAELIVSRGDEVGLDRERFRCDALEFEENFVEGRLEDALALYRGEMMPGFHVPDAPDFERWLDDERARLRERAREAAASLIENVTAAGEMDAAARFARRALEITEDERALRTLITLLDHAGDRAGALREFQRFSHRLQVEFGADPAPETLALIDQIRNREEPLAPEPDAASRPEARGPAAAPTAPDPDPTSVHPEPAPAPRPTGPARRATVPIAVAAVLAVVAAALFFGLRGPALDPKRVLVATFENRGADPALEPLGRMTAEWIAQELAGTQLVNVVDPATAYAATRDLAGSGRESERASGRIRDAARRTGSGIGVSGSYHRQGDSLRIDAWITDIRRGELIAGVGPIYADAADPFPALETLYSRVAGALATRLDPRVAAIGALSGPPPRYEAYRAWMAGVEAYGRFDFAAAIPQLERAHALDSTFVTPLIWIALAYSSLGQVDRVEPLLERIARARTELVPFETHYTDYLEALVQGRIPAQYEAARRMVETTPGSEIARYVLAEVALMMNRPHETIETLAQIDPTRVPPDFQVWIATTTANALHMIGDYHAELDLARRVRAGRPGSRLMIENELAALAALGRTAELEPLIDLNPSLVYRAGAELQAHGHPVAAQGIVARAETLLRDRLKATPDDTRTRYDLALAWYLTGRWEEAHRIIERLAAEEPGSLTYAGMLGTLAALRGDRREAEEISAELVRAGGSRPSPGRTYWRARIAAALGERDLAVQLMRQSFDQGNHFTLQLWHWIPELAGLAEDPPIDR